MPTPHDALPADANDSRGFYRAEIMTLQQITANLEIIAVELRDNRQAMTKLEVSVARIEERQLQNVAFKEDLAAIEAKVDFIEARNARQDGAFGFATFLKDFGPWALGIAAVAWNIFSPFLKK